uniref:Uncharacterized protein n=1 Tax=Amphimedon queenslandica TaxID=400682 RepID=A0A1X7UTI5_AMPQE
MHSHSPALALLHHTDKMASNISLHDIEDFIKDKIINENWTHYRLSQFLKLRYPSIRGFSVRTIERFCADKGIHRTNRLDDAALEQVVPAAVRTVGPSYGRKTMTGFLRSHEVRVSETRVGQALRHANPVYHRDRTEAATRSLNPVPYRRKNGTPNEIMRRANMTAYVQPSVLPETEDAVREMESLGSNLTYFSGFGIDPLQGQVHLIEERDRLFRQRYPDFGPFFHSVVNRDFHHFQQGLLFFIDKTRNLL